MPGSPGGCSSAPLSLVGVWSAVQITNRYGDDVESVMGQVLGAALLFGAIGLVAKSLVHSQTLENDGWELTNRDRVAAVLIGALGGFIVGLTSVGSGVFFGLTLLVLFPLRAHKVVGRTSSTRRPALRRRHGPLDRRERRLRAARLAAAGVDTRRPDRRPAQHQDPRACAPPVLAGVLGLAGIKLLDVPGRGHIVVVAVSAAPSPCSVGSAGTWIRVQRGRNDASGQASA